mmetsp:Transcript_16738/g.47754  ORF Transcript_16738/g.47754 Transcript_16738/m.47754 type:complete len:210 (+) Transcript_16738:731-1360(+)
MGGCFATSLCGLLDRKSLGKTSFERVYLQVTLCSRHLSGMAQIGLWPHNPGRSFGTARRQHATDAADVGTPLATRISGRRQDGRWRWPSRRAGAIQHSAGARGQMGGREAACCTRSSTAASRSSGPDGRCQDGSLARPSLRSHARIPLGRSDCRSDSAGGGGCAACACRRHALPFLLPDQVAGRARGEHRCTFGSRGSGSDLRLMHLID